MDGEAVGMGRFEEVVMTGASEAPSLKLELGGDECLEHYSVKNIIFAI